MAKVPTLAAGPVEVLESTSDIVAYIIRHSLKNPGFTSSFIEDELVSFRKLEAEHQNRDNLVRAYEQKLQDVIARNLPNDSVSVAVEWEDVDGFHYRLSIEVTDASGQNVLMVGKVTVAENDINIEFDSTY